MFECLFLVTLIWIMFSVYFCKQKIFCKKCVEKASIINQFFKFISIIIFIFVYDSMIIQ